MTARSPTPGAPRRWRPTAAAAAAAHLASSDSSSATDSSSDSSLSEEEAEEEEEEDDGAPPYPGFAPVVFRYLDQRSRPRSWCLRVITNPWFERVSMLVILLNCVTLGMYRPCMDEPCNNHRCKILEVFDELIFAFFTLEMAVKMTAMGALGKGAYLADPWNRLDAFIVLAGALEYGLNLQNLNLSAIRTIRVLRPLRAINRIPSMRILVMLLLDTLPMLGNVLLLCFFVFFIFGIVGVQLWQGILRQRCYLRHLPNVTYPKPLATYYQYVEQERDYICSTSGDAGMHTCTDLPPTKMDGMECNASAVPFSDNRPRPGWCVNWNQYYTECRHSPHNPFQGTISFDNIGLAWVAIFLVISLEGWTDVMYYVQDAHSFWDWIYFVLLIVIGSFFMINLCLVVIATQFSETKKREMERMRLERERFRSTSTLASSTNNSEPTSCYAEIVKYVAHLWRRAKRRIAKRVRVWRYQRQQRRQRRRQPTQPAQTAMPLCAHPAHGAHHYHHHHHVSHHHLHHLHHAPAPPAVCCGEAPQQQSQPPPSPTPPTPTPPRGGSLRVPDASDGAPTSRSPSPSLLSPPAPHRRRSSVVFSEVVVLHAEAARNVCSSEKMTQTGDGNLWPAVSTEASSAAGAGGGGGGPATAAFSSDAPMTCQELLALSGALSAALPTGQLALDSFFSSLSKGAGGSAGDAASDVTGGGGVSAGDGGGGGGAALECCWLASDSRCPHCCAERSCCAQGEWAVHGEGGSGAGGARRHRVRRAARALGTCCGRAARACRRAVRRLVQHKWFQQGILVAILINTLSMGIEYHNQPEELTVTVEYSNVVFSAVFAVEMLLKVVAEGPFGYVANGFNVFDGVIVVLSVVEMAQLYLTASPKSPGASAGSGLSVLRTFRLLRILKLVRFMPNLRRQLFVMLRTMDNVAVFFSLLILFIFIFSILGMYLFGGKFCMLSDGSRRCDCREIVERDPRCVCDRKHFNNILWATVTVFQILTQEDWNVVLFNGMEKTSHWAALYFVALMTFGNYVLFNLLVAILVEGFSAERNERREREQRELARAQAKGAGGPQRLCSSASRSASSSSSESDSCALQHGLRNTWRSAEELRKVKDNGHREKENCWQRHRRLVVCDEPKCNIQKESAMLAVVQPQLSAPQGAAGGSGGGPGGAGPPRITHTAATPQDSPSTTLEVARSSAASCSGSASTPTPCAALALYASSASIDSIDRSTSSQSSLAGPLRLSAPGTQLFNNACVGGGSGGGLSGRRVSLAASSLSAASSPMGVVRRCSWRLSRPSLRRRGRGRPDAADADADLPPLNNSCDGHVHCNGGLPPAAIRNDTQAVAAPAPPPPPAPSAPPNNADAAAAAAAVAGHGLAPGVGTLAEGTHAQAPPRAPKPVNTLAAAVAAAGRGGAAAAAPGVAAGAAVASASGRGRGRPPSAPSPLPRVKQLPAAEGSRGVAAAGAAAVTTEADEEEVPGPGRWLDVWCPVEARGVLKEREDFSLYLFPPNNRFRLLCVWFVEQRWFDNVVLLFIGLNCITLAMERPNIPPESTERAFLSAANYIFTAVFAVEMFVKVVATGMFYGREAYFTSGWNVMDGALVTISIVDLLMSLASASSPRIFNILRVFRLLRSLRPLRVINRAPGLKLVVQTLLSSLRPIGNIVLICCTFFIIFGILGVQLFKGTFYYCEGPNITYVRTRSDCMEAHKDNRWINRKYNFDDLGQALMSLFVLSSRDGWVNIMYTGLDAVEVDKQPQENYSEWRLLYFISFILLVGFFVLNMFVGVVVENFHRCREEQEKEERVRRAAKRARQMEKKRRKMHEPPYYTQYSHSRLMVHNVVTSKYFDLAIAAVIGLNVVTMALEFYLMPQGLQYALKIFNYFFTAVFILEAAMKLVALGAMLYLGDRWNQLDVFIVVLSVVGIVLEEVQSKIIPINPTIIRVMRVLRIARVLKLLKMAKGIRALLDTVMQALPQVGNLGLLFFLLFFIFAALGVELFGRLECSEKNPCQGLGEHAHFSNFGMAFLTLFRVATGDNWNGIMKDTLRANCDASADCVRNCCVSTVIAPIFFVIFVLMAQFVLVNVVVAVLMKHLEESHKQMEDELDMEVELERELAAEQELEEELEEACEEAGLDPGASAAGGGTGLALQQALALALARAGAVIPEEPSSPRDGGPSSPTGAPSPTGVPSPQPRLNKVLSLPADFTFSAAEERTPPPPRPASHEPTAPPAYVSVVAEESGRRAHGSLQRLPLGAGPGAISPISPAADVSPECVSAAVTLVPPPYEPPPAPPPTAPVARTSSSSSSDLTDVTRSGATSPAPALPAPAPTPPPPPPS